MNFKYFGDSYDLVKRFFCQEISALGYSVEVDPMFTDWEEGAEGNFYRIINASAVGKSKTGSRRKALLLDPDTGVREFAGKRHVSYESIAYKAKTFQLVFSFDQSFSRSKKPRTQIDKKLKELAKKGCVALYYDSHARFLFVSAKAAPIRELRKHLLNLGLPRRRLIGISK